MKMKSAPVAVVKRNQHPNHASSQQLIATVKKKSPRGSASQVYQNQGKWNGSIKKIGGSVLHMASNGLGNKLVTSIKSGNN